jgi:Ser/Thr protein kinase RdoA (MazF antagonist)
MTRLASFDPTLASAMLARAGLQHRPAELTAEERDGRWLVRLPAGRLAWFAASETGLAQLRIERRVLRLLEARCSFAAPRVLYESADGELDVRSMVPGMSDAFSVYAEVRHRPELAATMGRTIGMMLAEQHTLIGASDVAQWLPSRPAWPERREWIRERLPTVVDHGELIARAEAAVEAYESVVVADADRALVHTDVGFHNLGIDPRTFAVQGIFDYEGAAWADRHHDFRYLVLDFDGYEMLDAASEAYEAATGYAIQRGRVLLYNAACAVTFLAFRAGISPDARWCGRTLAEDVRWSQHAVTNALATV